MVMGVHDVRLAAATTWRATGEKWTYDIPCWVFTHRDLEPLGEDIRFVLG